MSELKFSCPHCSQHISCGPEWAGMQTQCPSCHNNIVIPKPPPAVPAAPSPGPLRVSMPSSHSPAAPPPPPPPARSSVPPPSASGLSVARPPAPPPPEHSDHGGPTGAAPARAASVGGRDNMVVQWAGLIGAFLVTAIIIGMAATWKPPQDTPYMRMVQLREAARQQEAEAAEDEEGAEEGASAPTPAPAAKPEWTLNLQAAQIPQSAASGQFGGRPLTIDRAYLQRTSVGYLFTVRQGTGYQAERELLIPLPVAPGQQLDGQTFTFAPDAAPAPRLMKRWLQNARQQIKVFTNGYALKLQFEQTANNQIPAKLFVALPDEEKTFIAGTVTASFLVAAAPQTQQRRQ